MKITVLFFGILKDVMASSELTMQEVSDLKNLHRQLVERNPELQRYVYRVFVNRTLASGNRSLDDGDEVALVPPFVGG